MLGFTKSSLFIALLLASFGVSAQTVITQSPPDPGELATADFSASFINQQAQRISLTADAGVSGVVAWGSYRAGLPSDNFTVRFFADAGGFPATTPFAESSSLTVNRVPADPPLQTPLGTIIYKYTLTLNAPIALAAATTYYFSITNNTSDAEHWNWTGFSGGGNLRWNRDGNATDANPWAAQSDFGLAFELNEGPIPTPTPTPSPTPVPALPFPVLALVAVIVMGFGVNRLRRR